MEKKRLPFALYRVLAYVTGVFLLLLVFVALPAKYLVGETAMFSLAPAPTGMEQWFGAESILMAPIAIPHGNIYMLYVLVVLWLALDRRWGAARTLGVMIAGTIPVVGLVVEHRLAKGEVAAEGSESRQEVPADG